MKRASIVDTVAYAILFVSIFLLSFTSPICSDDFLYIRAMYDAPHTFEVGWVPTWSDLFSIPDYWSRLLRSCWHCYFNENGRFTTSFLLKVLLACPRIVFAFVMALLWVMLSHLVWAESGINRCWKIAVFAILIIVGLCSDAVLWSSGAINYVLPMAITLLVLNMARSSKVLENRIASMRQGWLVFLLPFGILLAGCHELISITFCLFLFCYWMRRMIRREFYLNGKLLLTIGYGIGALLVVFGPATLNRASGAQGLLPDSNIVSFVVRKIMSGARLCATDPLALIVIFGLMCVAFSKKFRKKLDGNDVLWLFVSTAVFGLSVVLTDGGGRHGWCAAVLSAVAGLRLLKVFCCRCAITKRVRIIASFVLVMVALLVLSVTYRYTLLRVHDYNGIMASWKANDFKVGVMGALELGRSANWLDRSGNQLPRWGVGRSWTNETVARFYGHENLVVLDKWTYENVYSDETITGQSNCALKATGWYAASGRDTLVRKCGDAEAPHGTSLIFKPTYNTKGLKRLSVLDKIAKRLSRQGYAPYSFLSPEEEIANATPVEGCVLKTKHGDYEVVRHNPNVDRSLLEDLTIIDVWRERE